MKKLRVIMRVVGVLLVGVMMYSCRKPAVDEISLDVEKTKWEQSMYNAMYIAECKTLSLEDYKYLGDVTTEEDKQTLLDEIFGLDEYMVVANYEANIFDIITYGQSIEASTKDKNLYAPRKNNVASAIENRNIGVVELNWNYRGEKFKSKAIVAADGDKEFIYDNIMSYVPVDNQPEKSSIAKNTYRVNGKVVKEEVIDLPKMNHAEAGVAKTTYRVNGKVVKEEIEDQKALTNQK